MRYIIAREYFLRPLGHLTHEERLNAIAAFDKTIIAEHARFMDAWDELRATVCKSLFGRWMI